MPKKREKGSRKGFSVTRKKKLGILKRGLRKSFGKVPRFLKSHQCVKFLDLKKVFLAYSRMNGGQWKLPRMQCDVVWHGLSIKIKRLM